MKDRIPNPSYVLPNGAVRFGVYSESGTRLRYEYIKPEDAPTEEGTPLNKANLLSDAVASALGLSGDPTVNTALNSLNARAKIASGSYVGTGTYGDTNRRSLTFAFIPKLILIQGLIRRTGNATTTGLVALFKSSSTYIGGTDGNGSAYYFGRIDAWGQTVTWHADATGSDYSYTAYQQLNGTDTYHYVAIG